jgi:hypothetical protein
MDGLECLTSLDEIFASNYPSFYPDIRTFVMSALHPLSGNGTSGLGRFLNLANEEMTLSETYSISPKTYLIVFSIVGVEDTPRT